jgi:hypothetical protein
MSCGEELELEPTGLDESAQELAEEPELMLRFCQDLSEDQCIDSALCDPVYLQASLRQITARPIHPSTDAATARLVPIFTGCDEHHFDPVLEDHSLLVRSPDIVEQRQYDFAVIARQLAGRQPVGVMVEEWLTQFTEVQQIGHFESPIHPAVGTLIDSWPRLPDGTLNVRKHPFRTTSIVNRIDLMALSPYGTIDSCGEARVTYAYQPDEVFEQHEFPAGRMTIIAEFGVPNDGFLCREWGAQWARLSELDLESEEYREALSNITSQVFDGPHLNQLRTNEFIEFFEWELREFHRQRGGLIQVAVAQSPDASLGDHPRFIDWVLANSQSILDNDYVVPAPLLGASSIEDGRSLQLPEELGREEDMLNFNTCSGCHLTETGTGFVHVGERFGSGEAFISAFLADDLLVRADILNRLLGAHNGRSVSFLLSDIKVSAAH